MAERTGTLDISSLLAVRHQSVLRYGLENIVPVVEEEVRRHNERMTEAVMKLCERTVQRGKVYGTSVGGRMRKADEYTRGPTQRQEVGGKVDWPLDKFQFAIGWTREWFEVKTPYDLAIALLGSGKAHQLAIQEEFQVAIYTPTNRLGVRDTHDATDPNFPLNIKAFVNGDGDPIPDGPHGDSFDGVTHNHYLGLAAGYTAQQLADKLKETIDTVVEHGHGDGVRLYINRADEAEVSALPGFTELKPAYIINGTATDHAAAKLDITKLDNRHIGYFHGAEVHTKPWARARYFFVYAEGDPAKPLAFRESTIETRRGLRTAADLETHPLHARYMETYFGIGANTRTNGAALYVGNATYVDPV
jgi:hypothetical protein